METAKLEHVRSLRESKVKDRQITKIELVKINDAFYVRKTAPYTLEFEFVVMSNLNSEFVAKPVHQLSTNSYLLNYFSEGDLSHLDPMNSYDLISYFLQLCKSVEYIHLQKICHLDVKLENFVVDTKKVKLIDFGHARSLSQPVNIVLGTSRYNSPERYNGEYEGAPADIYSLGVCLLGLMVGFIPFARHNLTCKRYKSFRENPEQFWKGIERHLSKHNKLPDKGYGLDLEAIDLVTLMLHEDPTKRPKINEVFSHSFFVI